MEFLFCPVNFLYIRAFYKYEFEDVRKLAAELCGRIHPQVNDCTSLSYLIHFIVVMVGVSLYQFYMKQGRDNVLCKDIWKIFFLVTYAED